MLPLFFFVMLTTCSLDMFLLSYSYAVEHGPIGYWNFNKCDVKDESNGGNNGTLHGNLQCVNGIDQMSFRFDGASSYIDIGRNPDLKPYKSDFAISAWVMLENYSTSYQSIIISNRYPLSIEKSMDTGILFGIGGPFDNALGKIKFVVNGGIYAGIVTGASKLDLRTWYHVLMNYHYNGNDTNRVEVYLNGKLDGSGTIINTLDPAESPTWIGFEPEPYSPEAYHFYGSIDEVRIYGRVLSMSEINDLYEIPLRHYRASYSYCIIRYLQEKTYTGDKKIYVQEDIMAWERCENKSPDYQKLFIKVLRNEIFARHGRAFKNSKLKNLFESVSWYNQNDNFKASDLNKIERNNIAFIMQYEKRMGWK